ncbi:YceI family protein [Parvularcula sp. ZS-1/3]|uniref:YceI family protein n=1 Tax=Parvularcula mediterranea TaxID=2732508 RepID=A0A7Y3RP35_9PROT|nr:YceI family protein [Parvularcula mediterranea]NNU17672.1 YceI family protein [Parvularcula mediterranea]
MTKNLLALAGLLLIAACGGGEPAKTPNVEQGEVDLTVREMAGPSTWEIDREASTIRFRATQNNKEFIGTFGAWNAGILMNPESPAEEGEIEAIIDLASADAGTNDRNNALPEEGWFNTALHPTAIYRSNDITDTGEGSYNAEGTLTIKGITRDVSMPFALEIAEDGRAIADGSVLLDRSEFGVGSGEFADGKWVGLEVEVLLHIEAVPAG